MREIYMLNKGDSVDKIKYEYNMNSSMVVLENENYNFRYVEINKGIDDISIVRNYLPYYEYVIKPGDTIMDIMSRGFKVHSLNSIETGDMVILNKPKSIRYVARPLEKMADIAKKFGITEEYLMNVNNITTNKLFVGQILWI